MARGVGALDDSGGPRVTVIGGNDAQRPALDESLEQFRLHRLALPELQVRFSDDPDDCNGHLGGFRRGVVPWRIVVCSDLDFVIAHELAHAWCAANLDDERRQRYTAARGLPTWDDHDVPWEQRGIEDAAFVVQQNLMVRRSKPSLSSPTWRDRAEAYELLTGNRSPLRTP